MGSLLLRWILSALALLAVAYLYPGVHVDSFFAAVIAALGEVASRPEWASSSLEIYTDSEYVQKGITRWIRGWEANGWRTSNKQPVKNQDLWQRLLRAMQPHTIEWHWVRGHTGDVENERCDELAVAAANGGNLQEDEGCPAA